MMPKYYVLSGYINEVIEAESPLGACVKVVQKYEADDHKMQHLLDFAVSERGLWHDQFDHECDSVVDLATVLESAGWELE
jgi:hypothetical protein|tara:strand:- start:2549 stop:2788 length:240 start_codon:yes stop_codon:yes gene_type:complete